MTPAGQRLGPDPVPGGYAFTTTHWSMVIAAGDSASPKASEALDTLCRIYWYPLYAYIRRDGHDSHAAQDLTQEFFSRLLEKHWLRNLEREKGRFRSFLLAALKHFLANERRDAQRQKRGGKAIIFSLDVERAEGRYAMEPPDCVSPDKVFERRWAHTFIERTMKLLEDECAATGKGTLFQKLRGYVIGDRGDAIYANVAAELGMNEDAVKTAVKRLRLRYRALLRHEIAQTTSSPAEVENEILYLREVLRE